MTSLKIQIKGKRVWVGVYTGKRMPQIPFCDVICGSEVKRVWVAFPLLSGLCTEDIVYMNITFT